MYPKGRELVRELDEHGRIRRIIPANVHPLNPSILHRHQPTVPIVSCTALTFSPHSSPISCIRLPSPSS